MNQAEVVARLDWAASTRYAGDPGKAYAAVLGRILASCPELVGLAMDSLDEHGWPPDPAQGLDGP